MKSFLCKKSFNCTFDFLPSKNKKSEPTVIYELPVRIVRFKISDDSYEVIATNLSENLFSSDDLKYTVGLRYFHAILFLDFISLMILIESHANFFLDCLDLYHEFSFGVHLQTQCLDISIAKVLHFFHGSGHFCGFIYLVSKLQRVLSNE